MTLRVMPTSQAERLARLASYRSRLCHALTNTRCVASSGSMKASTPDALRILRPSSSFVPVSRTTMGSGGGVVAIARAMYSFEGRLPPAKTSVLMKLRDIFSAS